MLRSASYFQVRRISRRAARLVSEQCIPRRSSARRRLAERRLLPVPSLQDLTEVSVAGHEVVACSALRFGPRSVMSIACDSGDITTVCLDEHAALCLFEVLKVLYPAIASAPASPMKVQKTESGIGLQAGHVSD
jgi:hypothetical protein